MFRPSCATYLLFITAFTLIAGAESRDADAILNWDRMGAGPPGGWRERAQDCAWLPSADGPLGPGAGRIRFAREGSVTIESPVFVLPDGENVFLRVLARSEPAGANVSLTLRGNDRGDDSVSASLAATSEWQPCAWEGPAPRAVRGHYYLVLSVDATDTTVWLDGLWMGTTPPVDLPAHAAALNLHPALPWGLASGGEPLPVTVRVCGAPLEGRSVVLRLASTSGDSTVLPAIPLPAAADWAETVTIGTPLAAAFGMIRVEGVVCGPDGRALSLPAETLLARVPEPLPGPRLESPFGVHVKLQEPDLSVARKLGYKWLRIHDASGITKWGLAEPAPGEWKWFDDEVALARENGFTILGMLDGSPKWESGSPHEGYFSIYGAPRDIEKWRSYARTIVDHYAGAIDHWEVWNEPWDMRPDRFFQGGSPQLYAELLKAAYEETKASNPGATVVGIDTYPPAWDQAVLAMGALPFYDQLSFHRYDPALHGPPDDAIAVTAARLRAEQAKYGAPKPLVYTEGGPDVTVFHGSLFGFSLPEVSGDWSRGADQYARTYLSSMAAGVARFFAYSIHNAPRHGEQTHMLVEPGPLLRPMHVALAALAHFTDGAKCVERIATTPDITSIVFRTTESRPFADAGATVAAVFSNGEAPESLPRPIPAGIRTYDRWANAIDTPSVAERGPAYLVAEGGAAEALLAALQPADVSQRHESVEALVEALRGTLVEAPEEVWQLISSRPAFAAVVAEEAPPVIADRETLRTQPEKAAAFALPPDVQVRGLSASAGPALRVGTCRFVGAGEERGWNVSFTCVADGPGGGWRLTAFCLLPDSSAKADPAGAAALARWAEFMQQNTALPFSGQVQGPPFSALLCKAGGERLTFGNPQHFIAMLDSALGWGPAAVSEMALDRTYSAGGVTAAAGTWQLASPLFDPCAYQVLLVLVEGRLAVLHMSAE